MLKKVVSGKEKDKTKEVKDKDKKSDSRSSLKFNAATEGSEVREVAVTIDAVDGDETEQATIAKSDIALLKKYGLLTGDANMIWSYLKSGV